MENENFKYIAGIDPAHPGGDTSVAAIVHKMPDGTYRYIKKSDIVGNIVGYYASRSERQIKLHTGTGGADLFEEQVQIQGSGKKRLYIGRKPSRIVKNLYKGRIRKSHSGRFYVSIKISQY